MSIWLSGEELAALPTSGPGWQAVKAAADGLSGRADVANQDERQGEQCLAAALAGARLGNSAYLEKAAAVLASAPGTERGGRTLALGRNLCAYVVAADVAGYHEQSFVDWVDGVRTVPLDGGTLISTHERRANNWGTACGASRIAADLYLGDEDDLERAVAVFRGWLGDRSSYSGFKFGDLAWQADPKAPVGVNPAGSVKNGHPVGGCLPDDQRRGGGFKWPPPAENYVRAAISHSYVSATLLWQAGIDVFSASDGALRRAVEWFTGPCGGSFGGDDGWATSLIEWAYPGLKAGLTQPASVGKTMAWCAWTHGGRSRTGAPPPPPPPDPDPDPDPDPGPDPDPDPDPDPGPGPDPCAQVRAQLAAREQELAAALARIDSLNAKISNARAALG